LKYRAKFRSFDLKFKSPMETSRGTLSSRKTYILSLLDSEGKTGLGECSPVPKLSLDAVAGFQFQLKEVCDAVNCGQSYTGLDLRKWPSIKFAFECAELDLTHGGTGVYFQNDFTRGEKRLPLNGLIHMNPFPAMKTQLLAKIHAGFRCIKIKVGALDFDRELEFIGDLRRQCPASTFELRLDANGAFGAEEARQKIDALARFDIHSLEQPIMAGQTEKLAEICRVSSIPIALDEELVGISELAEQRKFLQIVKPQFLVLKPTLLGGFAACNSWISCCREFHVGYWVNSIMESNIGLSALSQWVCEVGGEQVHGLGTGQLFTRNFQTPVALANAELYFTPESLPVFVQSRANLELV